MEQEGSRKGSGRGRKGKEGRKEGRKQEQTDGNKRIQNEKKKGLN